MIINDECLKVKFDNLAAGLMEMERAVVAMSGGVDSLLLAKIASDVLGENMLAVTADSPSLPRRELRDAVRLAQEFEIPHTVIQTSEVSDPQYQANSIDRCYFCKDSVFSELEKVAAQFKAHWVCYGENVDDQSDYRPGSTAAREHYVRAPLKDVGLTKPEIRQLARALGLPIWDKPASACLASRFPYGMEITPAKLAQVEAAEDFLFELGFQLRRVRHHGEIARIEVEPDRMVKLLDYGADIQHAFREIGFKYITLDLAGYQRGRFNDPGSIPQK